MPVTRQLDVAIVFEHGFEPAPVPDGIEVITLFEDPLRVLLPAQHRLAARPAIRIGDLRRVGRSRR